MKSNLNTIKKGFDELQKKHGDRNLTAIYGAGETDNPDLFLVFMNPTARNVSADKSWQGLKAPWIGTKNVWKMFYQLGLFDEGLFSEIKHKKPSEWDYEFADRVYKEVEDRSIYITNLSKATQVDARPLKNSVFEDYLELFYQEIKAVNPKVIITFGNQVSSIFLHKNIKVSEHRKKCEFVALGDKSHKVYPVYYPVGQGMRNIAKAREDIDWILKSEALARRGG